jgi:hypothetical protein
VVNHDVEWYNNCDCCSKTIQSRFIDIYKPTARKRLYDHEYAKNGIWLRKDIIYVCIDCMLFRKNYANNPWWQITIPEHIPIEQIDRFAKRLLFGRRWSDKSRNDAPI